MRRRSLAAHAGTCAAPSGAKGVVGHADDEGPAMITTTASVATEPTKPTPSRGSSMDDHPGMIVTHCREEPRQAPDLAK